MLGFISMHNLRARDKAVCSSLHWHHRHAIC